MVITRRGFDSSLAPPQSKKNATRSTKKMSLLEAQRQPIRQKLQAENKAKKAAREAAAATAATAAAGKASSTELFRTPPTKKKKLSEQQQLIRTKLTLDLVAKGKRPPVASPEEYYEPPQVPPLPPNMNMDDAHEDRQDVETERDSDADGNDYYLLFETP